MKGSWCCLGLAKGAHEFEEERVNCPHCNESISLFSKELNRFGKNKTCPHCRKPIRLFVSLRIAGLLLVPAVVLILVLKAVFSSYGIDESIATAVIVGLLILLALRVKAA